MPYALALPSRRPISPFVGLTLAALVALGLSACGEVPPTVAIADPGPGAYLRGEAAVKIDFTGPADYHARIDVTLTPGTDGEVGQETATATLEREQLFTKGPHEVLLDTTGLPDGKALLKATAVNAAGQPNGSYAIEVFVDNGAAPLPTGDGDGDGDGEGGDGDGDLGAEPAVDVLAPADGELVIIGGPTSVELAVGGADELVKLELFAGEHFLGALRPSNGDAAPWVIDWDTGAFPPGPVALSAVATYGGGASVTDDDTTVVLALPGSEGDERAPTVTSLDVSRDGDLPEGVTVSFSATAEDDVAVARIELFLDGETLGQMQPDGEGGFTRLWDTTGQLGPHELIAVATDPAGNQAESAPLAVNVVEASSIDDSEAPDVGALSVDPAGPVQQGATVALAVEATDDVGLASVELYIDGVPAGAFSGAEPSFTLELATGAYSGSLSLEARALDLAGNLGSSEALTLVVESDDAIDWTPPDAHPFARVTSFPSNPSGDQDAPNPGNLSMYLHVPEDLPPGAPVIVAMHGCSQTASQFRNQSGWTELADDQKYIVIFPEQTITSDPNPEKLGNPYRCFNWAGYYGERMARGEGENQSIKEMIDWVLDDAELGADADEVFVTGFSAGGGMANLMMATWPEVFAGAAPMAGIPYGCADSRESAFGCMGVQDNASFSPRTGPGCESGEACMDPSLKREPSEWGDLVRGAGAAGYTGPYPKVIIWQGLEDQYVDDDNAIEMTEQWTDVHGATQEGGDMTLKDGAAEHIYREYTAGGEVVVATVELPQMSHGVAVDPGSGEDQGGTASNNIFAGGYAFDQDLFSAYYSAEFWGIVDWFDGDVGPGPEPDPTPDPEPGVEPEPEPEPSTCEDWMTTVQYHLFAFPPRAENVGDYLDPDYRVVGSGEDLNGYNLYLDLVSVRTTDVDGEFELGECP